jgi:DNA-binding MarR family transcriptional regulator
MKRNDLIEELLNFISGNSRENYDNWKTMKDSFMDEFKKYDIHNLYYATDEQLNKLAAICNISKLTTKLYNFIDPELEDVSISSHKDFITNKKVDYRVYTSISAMSNRSRDKQGERYIYLDKVNRNIKELSEVLGISVSMLRKHISTLKKMNVEQFLLEEYNGKLVYRLNYADSEGKNFVTVPMDKIPLLLNGLSNNCIKLYTVLLWACRTGEKALTQDWLAEQIGLSKKTKRAIKDNIDVLEKCGLIKVRREYNVKHKLNDGELTGYREPKYYYSIK